MWERHTLREKSLQARHKSKRKTAALRTQRRGILFEPLETRSLLTTFVSISDAYVSEGTGGSNSAVFTVWLSSAAAQTVVVPYNTMDGSASSSSDYTYTSGSVTFS